MNLAKSIDGTNILQLTRISSPDVKSKHVIVAIAGFTQEDQEHEKYWEHLLAYYKHAEIYVLIWTSCTAAAFHLPGNFKK